MIVRIDSPTYTAGMDIPWSLNLPRFGDAEQKSKWLQRQVAKCDDAKFGRDFAEYCPVPGVEPEAYQHRILNVDGERLLTGIRFKGCDLAKPFVDLIAWTGEPAAHWKTAVAKAFAPFQPLWMRFAWLPDSDTPWPAEVDQHVIAGPARGKAHDLISAVSDLSWYQDYHKDAEQWRETTPVGEEVITSTEDELQKCLDEGHVVVAMHAGEFLGMAACKRDLNQALPGWWIAGEYLVPQARGQGLGTALQRSLMNCITDGELVCGTIHGTNAPSLATARRCGREIVETWWFAPLRNEK